MKANPPIATYKALLWDYDYLLTKSDDECCYSLSEREVQILLAQIDYIAWKTRYKPTETEIDLTTILRWQGNLTRKLMSGCCPDDGNLYRFDEDGNLEVSTDGGISYHPAPEDDPRLTAPLFPPLPGAPGVDKKCESANNTIANIKAQADQMGADVAAWGGLTLLIAAILGIMAFLSILGSGGLLTPLVVALAGTLLTAGRAAFVAAMTTEVYETLNCIFFCNMQEDGSYTEANITEIKAQITAQLTGVAATYLLQIVGILGAVGLTNAGRTPGEDFDFDCVACECVDPCIDANSWSAGTVDSIIDNGDGTVTFTISSVDNGAGTQYAAWGSRTEIDSPCCVFKGTDLAGGTALGSATQSCGSLTETYDNLAPDQCLHYFHIYKNFALTTPWTTTVTMGAGC